MALKDTLATNIVVHLDLRKGSLVDQSDNTNNATFGGTPFWVNSPKGKGLQFDNSTDYLDVGATTESAKSIMVRLRADDITANTDYVVDLNGTDYITIVNGTVTANGFAAATTAIFVNGIESSTLDDTVAFYDIAVTSDTAFAASDLDVGRLEGTGFFGGIINEVIVFDTQLSEAQVSQLYQESLKEANLTDIAIQTRTASPGDLASEPDNLNGRWAMQVNGTTVTDLSGNGNDGTLIGKGNLDTKGFFDRGICFDGSTDGGSVEVASVTEVDNIWVGGGSFTAWVYCRSSGGGSNGRITSKGNRWHLRTSNEAAGFVELFFTVGFDGTAGAWDTTAAELSLNAWNYVVVTYDADNVTNDPVFYINASSRAITEVTTPVGTVIDDVTKAFGIGQDSGVNRTFDGTICDVRLYGDILTSTEVSDLYAQGNSRVDLNLTGENWEISDADVTAGFIENTPIQVSTGSWQIDDSSNGSKQLTNTAAGISYLLKDGAFGTWEFDVYKDADANVLDVMFIADTIGGGGAASQDGYGIRFDSDETIALFESVNGTPTDLVASAAQSLQTWYTVRVTRDSNGEFTLYVDGTSIGTATDTTTVASTYLAIDADAADAVRNIRYYPTIVTP